MTAEKHLDRIEAILADIERLENATGGQFHEAGDREAYDTACRVERKMRRVFVRDVREDSACTVSKAAE